MPTVLRQTAVGSSSAVGRIGAMVAPFVKELSESSGLWLALGIVALSSFINSALFMLIPESKGEEIPDTVGEAEELELKSELK